VTAAKNEEQTLLSNLRALPRPAWILFFGTFLNKFGTFVLPFLTLYLLRQGYTIADAGVAIGAYGAGNLSASLIGGYLADTIGRRKTIVLSMFSGAVAMLLLSQARSLPAIVALTALVGLAGELYRPASSALLADLIPPERRVTAFSAYRMAFNAGWAFGPATAGFLAVHGYFWLFVGDAVSSILFGCVAFFALPRGVTVQSRDSTWRDAWQVLRRDYRLHQMLLAAFAIAFVFLQMSSTFGLFVTQLGFSDATYGAILSLNGVLVVFCELPLTTITRRFPERKVIATGFLLIGAGFAFNSIAHSVAALAGCMALFTLGEMVAVPVSSAYIANLSPPHMRGRYSGVYGLTWASALIFAPAMGMKVLAYSQSLLWLSCGVLGVLAASIILAKVPASSHEERVGGPKRVSKINGANVRGDARPHPGPLPRGEGERVDPPG
jgi:MFS family permease